MEFQANQIRHTATRPEKEREDRVRPNVLPQFDLPQQFPHGGTIHSLWCKLLTAKLLDLSGRIRCDDSLFSKPAEESTDADEAAVHRGDGLPLPLPHRLSEIGNVTSRHPLRRERLVVGRAEPPSELPQVVDHCSATVWRQIMVIEKPGNERRLVLPDRDAAEKIITPILALFWTRIGHHLDTFSF